MATAVAFGTANEAGTALIEWWPWAPAVITGYIIAGVESPGQYTAEFLMAGQLLDAQQVTGNAASNGDSYRVRQGEPAQWRFRGLTPGSAIHVRYVFTQ